jgi:hypothetical protein
MGFTNTFISFCDVKINEIFHSYRKYPYIIKQQAFGGGACVCHGHFGGGACVCVNTGSSPKMEHAQTCPKKSPPDVVAVMTQSLMTQQPASPPDVYSKSSSKVLGRFPTIKSITGR